MNESLKKSLPPPRAILNQLYPKLAELRLPPKPCRPFHSPSLSEQLPPAGHFQQRLWLIFFQAAGSDSQFLLCVLHGRSLPPQGRGLCRQGSSWPPLCSQCLARGQVQGGLEDDASPTSSALRSASWLPGIVHWVPLSPHLHLSPHSALPALLSHSPEHHGPSRHCDGSIECVIPVVVENVSEQASKGMSRVCLRGWAERPLVLSSALINNPTRPLIHSDNSHEDVGVRVQGSSPSLLPRMMAPFSQGLLFSSVMREVRSFLSC